LSEKIRAECKGPGAEQKSLFGDRPFQHDVSVSVMNRPP
jgi:hypothetical protein